MCVRSVTCGVEGRHCLLGVPYGVEEERWRWETWLSGETQRMEREKVERDGRIALERGEMERAIGTLVEAREAEELERDEREAQLVLTANAAIERERAAKEKAEREMVDATKRGQELPRALERRGWDLERESETLFQRERAVGAVEAEQATQAAQALAREAELQSEIAHVREALRAERDRAKSTSAGAAGDAATAIKACRERVNTNEQYPSSYPGETTKLQNLEPRSRIQ